MLFQSRESNDSVRDEKQIAIEMRWETTSEGQNIVDLKAKVYSRKKTRPASENNKRRDDSFSAFVVPARDQMMISEIEDMRASSDEE